MREERKEARVELAPTIRMALSLNGVSRLSCTCSDGGPDQPTALQVRKQGRATHQLRELPSSSLVLAPEPPFYPLLVPLVRLCTLLFAEHDFDSYDLSLRGKGIAGGGVGERALDHGAGEEYIFGSKGACCMLLSARGGRLGLLQSGKRGEAVRQTVEERQRRTSVDMAAVKASVAF